MRPSSTQVHGWNDQHLEKHLQQFYHFFCKHLDGCLGWGGAKWIHQHSKSSNLNFKFSSDFWNNTCFLMRHQPTIISGIDYQGTKDQVSAALKFLGKKYSSSQGVAMESALETCCLYIDFLDKNAGGHFYPLRHFWGNVKCVKRTCGIYMYTSKWSQVCKV